MENTVRRSHREMFCNAAILLGKRVWWDSLLLESQAEASNFTGKDYATFVFLGIFSKFSEQYFLNALRVSYLFTVCLFNIDDFHF